MYIYYHKLIYRDQRNLEKKKKVDDFRELEFILTSTRYLKAGKKS